MLFSGNFPPEINFQKPTEFLACKKRLKKIIENGNRRGLSEPDEKEVALATKHIYTNSMFGVTLDELMAIQSEKRPELEIPWIQVIFLA